MTAGRLLADLRARGAVLTAAGDRLDVDAPAGLLTPAVLAELRARKPELLALLAAERQVCLRCGTAGPVMLVIAAPAGDYALCATCFREPMALTVRGRLRRYAP